MFPRSYWKAFLKRYFILFLIMCGFVHISAVPVEARRGHPIPREQALQAIVSHQNWIHVLSKGWNCSELLGHPYFSLNNNNKPKTLLELEKCVGLPVLIGIIPLVYSSSKWSIYWPRAMRILKLPHFLQDEWRCLLVMTWQCLMPHPIFHLAQEASVKKLGTDTGFWRLRVASVFLKYQQQMSPRASPGTQVHLG